LPSGEDSGVGLASGSGSSGAGSFTSSTGKRLSAF
jgi:hypothetical protein